MTKGTYWVGDLCYVLGDVWDEFCDLTLNDGNRSGEYTLSDGRRFAYSSTSWGDGVYLDQMGNKYPVDAGLIGCVLADSIKPSAPAASRATYRNLGHVHTFLDDFEMPFRSVETRRNGWNGDIEFGLIKIPRPGNTPRYEILSIATD